MKFEGDIIRFFQANISTGWVTTFQIITLFGSFIGFLITFFILFMSKRKLSYVFVITFIFAQMFNRILKLIIARDRPFVVFEDIINYGNEDGFSMPSGHSMSVMIFATFIFYHLLSEPYKRSERIIGGITMTIVIFAVMLSRMVLGVHYLTDTIVGLIVGITFAIIAILLYNKSAKRKIRRITKKE